MTPNAGRPRESHPGAASHRTFPLTPHRTRGVGQGRALAEAALAYARRGWPVLPLEPRGKRPAGRLVPNGLHDASSDPATVERWWRRMPGANVGLATGVAFDVLDLDGAAGAASLGRLVECHGELPAGPVVVTGKGRHHYFAPTGLGNRAGVVAGLDFRGLGGYVVAPPSVHPSGRHYRWHVSPLTPLPEAPAWLLSLLSHPAGPSTPPLASTCSSPYGRAALEREAGRVALAPVGARNDTLNRAAFAIGRLVAGGEVDVEEAAWALLVAAERAGLTRREAERTLASGLRAGLAEPRSATR